MRLKFYKLRVPVKSPKFGTEGSACFDISAWIEDGVPITV